MQRKKRAQTFLSALIASAGFSQVAYGQPVTQAAEPPPPAPPGTWVEAAPVNAPAAPPQPASSVGELSPVTQPAPPPAPVGKVELVVAPERPSFERHGYHVHDGFYLRIGAGLGGGPMTVESSRSSSPDLDVGGSGLSLNLWVGGTPFRGIAMGGLLTGNFLRSSEVGVGGRDYDESVRTNLTMAAFFVDAFPDAQRGLHIGGALGIANVDVHVDSAASLGTRDFDARGLGMSAWIGYMGWVGPEWSLGGMLQLTGAVTRKADDDAGIERQASGAGLDLSLTALFH